MDRDFYCFLLHPYQPRPLEAIFLHQTTWNLREGHPRNITTKLFENQPDTFGEEDCLNFNNSPALWWPCFLTNQHGLKEPDSGSLKKHFCIII